MMLIVVASGQNQLEKISPVDNWDIYTPLKKASDEHEQQLMQFMYYYIPQVEQCMCECICVHAQCPHLSAITYLSVKTYDNPV